MKVSTTSHSVNSNSINSNPVILGSTNGDDVENPRRYYAMLKRHPKSTTSSSKGMRSTITPAAHCKKIHLEPNEEFLQSNSKIFNLLGSVKKIIDLGGKISNADKKKVFKVFTAIADQYLSCVKSKNIGAPSEFFVGTVFSLLSDVPEFISIMQEPDNQSFLIKKFGKRAMESMSNDLDKYSGVASIIREGLQLQKQVDREDLATKAAGVPGDPRSNDIRKLSEISTLKIFRRIFDKEYLGSNAFNRSKSIKPIVGTPLESLPTDLSMFKAFIRNSSHEILDLLHSMKGGCEHQKEAIDNVLYNLKLYGIQNKPIDSCTENDRFHGITTGLVKWVLEKSEFKESLKNHKEFRKYLLESGDHQDLFSDFETIRSALETQMPVTSLGTLNLYETEKLCQFLYRHNLLIILSSLIESQPLDTASNLHHLACDKPKDEIIIEDFSKVTSETIRHCIVDTIDSPQFSTQEFKVQKDTNGVHRVTLGSIESVNVKFEDEIDDGFRGDLPIRMDYSFGQSPQTIDEIHILIKLGLNNGHGCMQYVSPERLLGQKKYSTASIVSYCIENRTHLLGCVVKLDPDDNMYQIRAIDELGIDTHSSYARTILVTLVDEYGNEKKVPFTDVGLPYEHGGLSEDSLKAALDVEKVHLSFVSPMSKAQLIQDRPPVILSRGGVNRCVQHIVARDQFKWIDTLKSTIEFNTTDEVKRQTEYDEFSSGRISSQKGDLAFKQNLTSLNKFLLNNGNKRVLLLISQLMSYFKSWSDSGVVMNRYSRERVSKACELRLEAEHSNMDKYIHEFEQKFSNPLINLSSKIQRQNKMRERLLLAASSDLSKLGNRKR